MLLLTTHIFQPSDLNGSPWLMSRVQCVETCRGHNLAVVNTISGTCHCLASITQTEASPYNCAGKDYTVTSTNLF